MDQPSPEKLIGMLERMMLVREFDEQAAVLAESDRILGAVHLYCGEEGSAVGICSNLTDDDYVTSTHRGHGHCLAKGGDPKQMYAELFGRTGGYCKGKGGSMHIADLDLGILGANGIVGAGPPIAMGAAFACKYQGNGTVAVCFFGDGASNQGTFHEAANMAALYKLPLLLVCENNLYGEFTRQDRHQTVADVAARAAGYDIPGVVVDGQDVMAVYEAANEAVRRARAGEGPTLIEVKTYRFYDHVGRSFGRLKRDPEEEAYWRARDPIQIFREQLSEQGVLKEAAADALLETVRARITEAVEFAESSPWPDPSVLLDDVYTEAS